MELEVQQQILTTLTDLRRQIADLEAQVRSLKSGTKGLLSRRQAAARLGIDRNTVLPDLIHTNQIRTVLVNGVEKIPASEVERLCGQGFDSRRRQSRGRTAKAVSAPTDPKSWKLSI